MRQAKSPHAKEKKLPARLERRVRVTFFLPAETEEQKKAASAVVWYLDGQMEHPVLPVTGFTHSVIPGKSAFHGHWWHKTKKEWKILTTEEVALFLIDFLALAEEWKLDQELARLKTEIHACYAKHKCRQEEVWMVKEDIHRYA